MSDTINAVCCLKGEQGYGTIKLEQSKSGGAVSITGQLSKLTEGQIL